MIPKRAQTTTPLGLLHDQAFGGVRLRSVVVENTVASRENTEVESAALRWVHQFFIGESQPKIHIMW